MEDNNYEILPDDPSVVAKKGKIKRQRNLVQYKNMTDEEFDRVITEKALGVEFSDEFEKRINLKLDEFGEDYDLSDLKINDRMALRALIQAVIGLEDYEQLLFRLRTDGINTDTAFKIEKLQKIMSDLRADISKIQTDLNITRKVRKSDQDVSVMAYIEDLKTKARKFYESKMFYVFCPKCNMLISTIWYLYPEEDNYVVLKCNRTMDDDSKCGTRVKITSKELLANRGTNNRKIIPESMV